MCRFLLEVAIRNLNVRAGGTYIDATLGMAGHSLEIAKRLGPEGTLIGFDRDPEAMAIATRRLEVLRGELGEAMPKLVLHSEEFSFAAGPGSAGLDRRHTGRLRCQQHAAGRSAQRI